MGFQLTGRGDEVARLTDSLTLDITASQRRLEWTPPVSLEEGIRRMAKWVQQHGARESSVFDNIEIPKNLPPSLAAALISQHTP